MIKRIVITLVTYLLLIFLLHLLIYKFIFTYEHLSNVMFIIGFISFTFGLISMTNAQNVFIGIRYYGSLLFRKKYEEKLDYSEYKEDKYVTTFTYKSQVMFFVGIIIIIIAFILAYISL